MSQAKSIVEKKAKRARKVDIILVSTPLKLSYGAYLKYILGDIDIDYGLFTLLCLAYDQ